jgi:hypothetical protein
MFSAWAEKTGLFSVLAPPKKRQPKMGGETGSRTRTRTGATCSDSTDEQDDEQQRRRPPSPPEEKTETQQTLEQQQQQQQNKRDLLRLQQSRETRAFARNDFCQNQRVRYYLKSTNTWYEDAYIVGIHYDDDPERPYYTIIYQQPVEEQQQLVGGPAAALVNLRQEEIEQEHAQEMILLEKQQTNGVGFNRTSIAPADSSAAVAAPTSPSAHCSGQRMNNIQYPAPAVAAVPPKTISVEKQTTRDRLEYVPWDDEKTWSILYFI